MHRSSAVGCVVYAVECDELPRLVYFGHAKKGSSVGDLSLLG